MPEISPENHPKIEQIPQSDAEQFLREKEALATEAQTRRFFPQKPDTTLAEKTAAIITPEKPAQPQETSDHGDSSLPESEWLLIEKDPMTWIQTVLQGKNLTPAQQNEGMAAAIERIKTSETIH